jgi:DNA-binding PadR family transcriptional regulator
MGPSEVGKALEIFSKNNLVIQIDTKSRREKIYKITDDGKNQLNLWLRHLAGGEEYMNQVQDLDMPDLRPVYKLLAELKEQIARELRASRG